MGVGLLCASRSPAVDDRLNVLLITLDTTRADYLGCYGREAAHTPNLDRLAREGARCTRCATCTPLTLPSHASILTGVYPYVHGLRRNGLGCLPTDQVTLAQSLRAAGYQTFATVAAFVLNHRFGLDQGFDVYHDVNAAAYRDAEQPERKADEVCTDAVAMLRARDQRPFFMWVHFFDPHYPYESPRHADPASPNAYADEIAFVDAQIGRLLAELEQLNLARRTLIVVVADHGEGLGDHGELTHGYFIYDSTVRTPLIVRCPDVVPADRTIAAQVRTIDIAPTILELVGHAPWSQAQGVSLAPLLAGTATDMQLAAYCESFEASAQFELAPLRSLTVSGWKYILAPRAELYHVAEDVRESLDLAAVEPQRAAGLHAQLRALLAEAPPPPERNDVAGLNAAERARLASLGYAGADTGETEAALTELDHFDPEGRDPKDYAALLRANCRSRWALHGGRAEQAEDLLLQVVAALPHAPDAWADLGQARRLQGHLPAALLAYEQALLLAPDDTFIRGKYAAALCAMRRWDDAIGQFQTILQQSPRNVFALHNLGVALATLGRTREAAGHLDTALTVEPDNPHLLHARGMLYARQSQFGEAVAYFRRALALDPQFRQCAEDLRRAEQALGY